MAITTQSAKAKGRNLQKLIRDYLLELYPDLTDQDIRSTSMGASGVDILFSTHANKKIPYSIEAKMRAKLQLYTMYDQAVKNTKEGTEPLLIIRANRRKALVVVDMEHFFKLMKQKNG